MGTLGRHVQLQNHRQVDGLQLVFHLPAGTGILLNGIGQGIQKTAQQFSRQGDLVADVAVSAHHQDGGRKWNVAVVFNFQAGNQFPESVAKERQFLTGAPFVPGVYDGRQLIGFQKGGLPDHLFVLRCHLTSLMVLKKHSGNS